LISPETIDICELLISRLSENNLISEYDKDALPTDPIISYVEIYIYNAKRQKLIGWLSIDNTGASITKCYKLSVRYADFNFISETVIDDIVNFICKED